MDKDINRQALMRLGFLFNNIKREEMQSRLGDSEVLNCIFNHLDKLDGVKDNSIGVKKIFDVNSSLTEANNTLLDNLTSEIHTGVDKGGFFGDLAFIIDDEKIQKYIDENPDLKNVTKEDFKDCLSKLIEYGDEKLKIENERYRKKQIELHPELPESVATQIADSTEQVKTVRENGKNYYEVFSEMLGWRKYNENGELVALKSEVLAVSESSEMFNTLGSFDQTEFFEEGTGDVRGVLREYHNSNVREYEDYQNNTIKRILGKTEFNFNNDRLLDVKINSDLPNEVRLESLYDDNGNIADFKLSGRSGLSMTSSDGILLPIDTPVKMADSEKEMLKNLLNSGAKFGEDFSLEMENNIVKLNLIIKNDTDEELPKTPVELKNEVFALAQKGLRNNRDYTLTYNKNGSYEIDFETAKARNYETEDTRIVYSKDGKTRITHTLQGDSIKTVVEAPNSKNVSTQSRKDAFLEKILEGDFQAAGKTFGDIRYQGSDFDFYAVCEKYEQITGKKFVDEILRAYDNKDIDKEFISQLVPNFAGVMFIGDLSEEKKDELYKKSVKEYFEKNIKMFSEVNKFDVSKSHIADLLYDSKKETISENKYSEISNGQKFTVTKNQNSITVEKDGKSYIIKLKNINPNIQNMIFNSNANILYRLASQQTEIDIYSNRGRTVRVDDDINGLYTNNKISLNSETMTQRIMQRTLAHETGHSFYKLDDPKNEELEAAFNKELEAFNDSDEQFKHGDHAYCASNIYEMVAECYTLLTTGHAKSEYTIAKYFPNTFALVKKLVEAQSK